MTERKPPDDRELEQYLKGDSPLSRRYRDASREASPPELDEAILARARAEAKRKPPSLNRYLAPVALAASLVLGVNLAWNLHQAEPVPAEVSRLEKSAEPGGSPEPAPAPQAAPAGQAPAPAAPPPEARRRAATPPAKVEESLPLEDTAARERELDLAAAQAQSEERAALAQRSETDSQRREMLRAQGEPGSAGAARSSDPFEQKAKAASDVRGMLPAGWYLMGRADYYEASVDETIHRSAPSSLVMWRTGPGVEHCGRLQTETLASAFIGRQVRLRASLRAQGVTGQNVLLFLTHARGGQVWWDPSVSTRFPASDSAWQTREITASIPDNAERVVYGALLCGPGTLWLDDTQLSPAGAR